VWGLDAAAFSLRVPDSQEAIREAAAAGLHSYLFIWHARHNSLEHKPEFEQVDWAGHHLFAFDTFNPAWRHGPWKTYLEVLGRSYGPESGLAGYVFDNSFAIGRIGGIDGPAPTSDESYIFYGEAEKRAGWWADWAKESVAAIRGIDPRPDHEIFIEDGENAIDPDTVSRVGVDFQQVAKYFDAVGAYFAPAYSDPKIDSQLETLVQDYLRRMQSVAGVQKVALSLRLSEGTTVQQIRRIVDVAVAMGVRHIDFYGYRMGVYHLDAVGWEKYRPKHEGDYELTGEVRGTFVRDRKDIWPDLTKYFLELQMRFSH